MWRGSVRAALALGALLGLHGCVRTSVPQLPTALGPGEGLLVARLYVPGLDALDNAQIDVDGSLRSSAMRDGYVAIPLAEGAHTLKQLRVEGHVLGAAPVEREAPVRLARGGGAPIHVYGPGTTRRIEWTTLSIERSFEITPGRITNLGLMVYLPVVDPPGTVSARQNGSRQFKVFAVDNGAETRAFLETNYPALTASLPTRELVLAPARYLAPDKLPDLRRAIAYHESRGPHVVASRTTAVVYGRAGTLVALRRDAPAEPGAGVEILDPGTLADVLGGVVSGERFTFVTSDGKVLTWEGGAVAQAPLPTRAQPVGIWRLGATGLLVVDNRMRLYASREPGAPWQEYTGYSIDAPRNDIQVAPDGEGAYISLGDRDAPRSVSYLRAGASAPSRLAPPLPEQSGSGPYSMVARGTGLYVLYGASQPFLQWRRSDGQWRVRKLPAASCKPMVIGDDGRDLRVECSGQIYRSTDAGATWSSPTT